MKEPERLEITDADMLWRWLAQHHARTDGVLLVTWKAAHPDRFVGRDAILDALVAHGWIDGRRFKLDTDRTMQLITPRRTTSWADSYRRRAIRLQAEGRMHPAGDATVRAGQAVEDWNIVSDVDALVVPDDLVKALANHGDAWFKDAAPSYRRNVLRWIASAKTAPTRAKRITSVADHAARGQKVPNY